jgi:hypothetical protein
MDTDFHAGRLHAGWSTGIKTLEKYEFVQRTNCRAELINGQWTFHRFAVTGEGREFTNHMIAKFDAGGSDDEDDGGDILMGV